MAHPKGWAGAWAVLAAYVATSFVLAVLLPASIVAQSWIPFDTHLSRSFAAASAEPERVRLYWAWMLLLAPPALIAFSIAAPIRLDKMAARDKEGSILMLVIGFVLFGYLATPWSIYMLFNLDVEFMSPAAVGRGRFVDAMSHGRMGLFCGGSFLTTGTLLSAWIAYVAIPTGYVKVLRFHRLQRLLAPGQPNGRH